jgi:selenophosphate synthetase-related protein
MAGILGSLAMLLEATAAGASVDLASLPRPAGTPLALWTAAFPSYSFLLCCPPRGADECRRLFRGRGLACEAIGTIDATGELRVHLDGRSAVLVDLRQETITGLRKG